VHRRRGKQQNREGHFTQKEKNEASYGSVSQDEEGCVVVKEKKVFIFFLKRVCKELINKLAI